MSELSGRDIEDIESRGLSLEAVSAQKSFLLDPPPPPRLARPCTAGDGVFVFHPEESASFLRLFARAREEGRFSTFIPASGAASRMFKDLFSYRRFRADASLADLKNDAASRPDARETLRFMDGITRFPFAEALADRLSMTGGTLEGPGGVSLVLDVVLGKDGLDLPSQPKALIPFHRVRSGSRTALEEHLLASLEVLRDGDGVCRLHFTVSQEHEDIFRSFSQSLVSRLERAHRCSFQVSFSRQNPSTDTVSLEKDGRLARDAEGRILFRPGGHGALLENLNALKGDVVFLRNIDNIPHDSHPGEESHWDGLLAGCLLDLQENIFRRISWLTTRPQDVRTLEEAVLFARQNLNITLPEGLSQADLRGALLKKLDRPLRVCAVVKNTGEPGGGPFWVRAQDGTLSPQIIESAQAGNDPTNKAVFAESTHFNPVHMVCGLRNWRGHSFSLSHFSDPAAVFIAEKSHGGNTLRVLERPGLWNGGMSDWTTVFVEAPVSTFHPVKTVNDLLRSDHQPSGSLP